MKDRGFGLFSLLITFVLISLLLWLVTKSLSGSLSSFKVENGVNQTPLEAAKQVKKILENQDAARAREY